MEIYVAQFGRAWFWTILIESLILMGITRGRWFQIRDVAPFKILSAGLIASSLTLPYLWFVLAVYVHDPASLKGLGEPLIYLIEALFYMGYLNIRFGRALLISSICNTGSLMMGMLFYRQMMGS